MGNTSEPCDRLALDRWRNTYAESAVSTSWLEAHQWTYGADVARATAMDVRSKLKLEPHHRLLEVGSGSGAFLDVVMHPGQQGIGFDLCEEQVRGSRKFGMDDRRIKLGVAQAVMLPVASGEFDRVLCYSVIHYFPGDAYVRSAIVELLRVCRVGGLILLGDVAGIMERTRKNLLRNRVPEKIADLILWSALPARHLFRTLAGRKPREGRQFRRTFLATMLTELGCEFEFLDQAIPGRPASDSRFDIRICKRA